MKKMSYLWFTLGLVTGLLISNIKPSYGTLRIDRSNPEKDLYRFEVDGDIDKLHTKKRVVFKVDNNANLSQN